MSEAKLYFECSCCGQYHPIEFFGDCREDTSRIDPDDLLTGWVEVDPPDA